jgi:glyoxylase-like metal-dependent hydrolase (beta-lactamase superfamily II)
LDRTTWPENRQGTDFVFRQYTSPQSNPALWHLLHTQLFSQTKIPMKQVALSESACADHPDNDTPGHQRTREVLPVLAYQRLGIVNVVYHGPPDAVRGQWVLIDAGLPGSSQSIKRAAADRFGEGSRPACIIMTHAHADHAGGLERLAEEWNVPVFAHELEIPYLNGSAAYPPPDTKVGGGLMPMLSVLFPRGPFNVSRWLQLLPDDHSVPHMDGWVWIHTPGHTPGHISLWNHKQGALIAGDAFITTDQESVYAVLKERPEMHGPPMYYTQNWIESEASVQRLAALRPEIAITGHGHAMRGQLMREALHRLANEFKQTAVPSPGKYVTHPTSPLDGTAYQHK